jgi:hypothetical protein
MCALVILPGCFSGEDTSYLTPIPEATLAAYQSESPIENKLQAVIAAQRVLQTTRLDYQEEPVVVSVDEMRLEKAHQSVQQLQPGDYFYEDRPDDTKVWLVMFEGMWRIIPPDPEHTYTPEPFSYGCIYVIIDRDNRSEMGTIACPDRNM